MVLLLMHVFGYCLAENIDEIVFDDKHSIMQRIKYLKKNLENRIGVNQYATYIVSQDLVKALAYIDENIYQDHKHIGSKTRFMHEQNFIEGINNFTDNIYYIRSVLSNPLFYYKMFFHSERAQYKIF